MTTQITQPEVMTDEQRKQIRRLFEDGFSAKNLNDILDALGFSKEEAQEVIEKGDLLQADSKTFTTELLKKLAVVDKRFGPALVEFDVTVPLDYDHDKFIDQAGKEVRKLKTTYYYNDDLTSENFAKATNKLIPGKTYRAKIIPILETVTSADCMNMLRKQRAILVGGQGLMLAQSTNADKFPIDKWTVSFDEKEALWKDSVGDHRVPIVYRRSDGDWRFSLGDFELVWDAGHCLLCFCDK